MVTDTVVYIAGAWESKNRLAPVKRAIQNLGLTVGSSWLEETGTNNVEGPIVLTPAMTDVAMGYANRDVEEVMSSNLFILDTIETNDRGGKDVEFGIAYFTVGDVWIVGPVRNVFQNLADRIFDNWDEALEAIKNGDADPQ